MKKGQSGSKKKNTTDIKRFINDSLTFSFSAFLECTRVFVTVLHSVAFFVLGVTKENYYSPFRHLIFVVVFGPP